MTVTAETPEGVRGKVLYAKKKKQYRKTANIRSID